MKFVKLNELCEFEKGSTGLAKAEPGDYPLVTTGAERKSCSTYQFDAKAVCIPLVSSTGHGHASLKNVHYQEGKFALGSILVALSSKDSRRLDIQFLHLYLSQLKDQVLVPLMSGAANVALSVKKIQNIEIPLPEIERQREIVERFKSIVAEEDELKSELTHQQTLLKKLRQQILQEAIEGKLTADWRAKNPDVEPASELLKRVSAEKAQLVKDKKIKAQKPLPPITHEEKPFELPHGWEWCRLGDLILMHYGKALTKAQTKSSGKYPVYGSNGKVGYHSEGLTDKRSIIVGRKGSAGALQVSEGGSWTTDVAYFVEESQYLVFNYLMFLLRSLKLEELGKGIKPGLNRDEAYSLKVPLASFPEQEAIVTKAEQLFALCDQLETQITQNQSHAEQLMQAVLKEAFSHNSEAETEAQNSTVSADAPEVILA